MVGEAGVVELFVEHATELVQVAEIEGTEIQVEVVASRSGADWSGA